MDFAAENPALIELSLFNSCVTHLPSAGRPITDFVSPTHIAKIAGHLVEYVFNLLRDSPFQITEY